jgi:hypothetical protein
MWPSQPTSLCAWPFWCWTTLSGGSSCHIGNVHPLVRMASWSMPRAPAWAISWKMMWRDGGCIFEMCPVCLSKVVMLILDYNHHLKPWLVLCPLLRCIYRWNLATSGASMFQLKPAAQSGPKCHLGLLEDANSGWLTYWIFLLSWKRFLNLDVDPNGLGCWAFCITISRISDDMDLYNKLRIT